MSSPAAETLLICLPTSDSCKHYQRVPYKAIAPRFAGALHKGIGKKIISGNTSYFEKNAGNYHLLCHRLYQRKPIYFGL